MLLFSPLSVSLHFTAHSRAHTSQSHTLSAVGSQGSCSGLFDGKPAATCIAPHGAVLHSHPEFHAGHANPIALLKTRTSGATRTAAAANPIDTSERAARSPTPLNPAGFEPRIPRAPNSGLMCAVCVSFPRIKCELACETRVKRKGPKMNQQDFE